MSQMGEDWTTTMTHRLRRVQTGHGFGMTPSDAAMSTSVFLLLYAEGFTDAQAFKGAMTPAQARALGTMLLDSADAAEAEPIP